MPHESLHVSGVHRGSFATASFHTGEDHSAMALAIDRRRALEDEEEAEEAEE